MSNSKDYRLQWIEGTKEALRVHSIPRVSPVFYVHTYKTEDGEGVQEAISAEFAATRALNYIEALEAKIASLVK